MANILTNAGNIAQNIADITGLQSTVNTNYGYSQTSRSLIETNDGNIDDNADAIDVVESAVQTNETNILNNASAISSNDSEITALESSVQTNTAAIEQLQSDFQNVSGNLATNHHHDVLPHTHAIPDHQHPTPNYYDGSMTTTGTATGVSYPYSPLDTSVLATSSVSGTTTGPEGSTSVGHTHDHSAHTHDAHHYHVVPGGTSSATIVQPEWHVHAYPAHNLTTSYETTNTPTAPQ